MNKQWKIWRRVCCGVVALAAAWLLLAWLTTPAEPAAGPLRHDIEPLQKRLGAGLGIRSAQWRARRSHAETGLIPAGKSALKLKLAKPLEPGTYEATVLVQPYRVDDQSKTNNAEIKTVIIAE